MTAAVPDWSRDLDTALADGDPAFMRAMLARVPKDVLRTATPYIHEMAKRSVAEGRLEEALVYYDQLLEVVPDKVEWRAARDHARRTHDEALLKSTPGQDVGPSAVEPPPAPEVLFDPALLDQAGVPEGFEPPMVDGLRQLLSRYSGHQSSRNTLARLEDRVWLQAWDEALSGIAGASVLLRGSELGTFALRALQHGARRVVAVEESLLDGRIGAGILQKNLLMQWHARHGAAIKSWSDEERRTSFEAFAHDADVVPADSEVLATAQCDCFVFPDIDHSLLGTGIVKAVRQYRQKGLAPNARILPAKAKVFAVGIEWLYPSTPFKLQHMNQFRWSPYPLALDLARDGWKALTEAICIAEIDFESFQEATLPVELPVIAGGRVDAIVYWFELQLGTACISNEPGSALSCIRSAVQYTDPIEVEPGQGLPLEARLQETRLYLRTAPPVRQLRSRVLPGWYVPMLLDKHRNDAYGGALDRALRGTRDQVVLDIGAGCGLLSMLAAQAGAFRVIGCEVNRAIAAAGMEIVRANHLDDRITFINKDSREVKVPEDFPGRADLAVFELFDCSLIGEGVLHFLAHARQNLLKENARYLPMAARIRAMVVEYRLDRVWDIDVNLLNPYRFSSAFINVDASRLRYRALTEPVDVFSFDFATATPTAQESELRIPAVADGIAGAILFWFDLQLDETLWISNAPANLAGASEPLHWKQGLQFLPEVQVQGPMPLPLTARHDGSSLTFRWQQAELPKEVLSRLPRFDPRSIAAIAELEQQTRGLLQHCANHPEESARVAQLAQHFAIDPGAHGLDPVIAQRFAATFFGG